MDDVHDAEPEHSPYVRLPWPLVAAGLVGILLVALGIGLFANRSLRQAGVVPTPIPVAAPVPAPTPAAAPTVAPTPTSAPEPTPRASATAVTPTANAPATNVKSTSTSLSASASGATTSPPASPLPTLDPLLADEVGKAYEMFWRIRGQALLELDTTHLAEVMDDEYLQNFEMSVGDLRVQGRAIETQVSLNYVVVEVSGDSATVIDHIEDDSFYVVPGTLQPLTDPANDVLRIQFKLRRTDSGWKVVDSVSAD